MNSWSARGFAIVAIMLAHSPARGAVLADRAVMIDPAGSLRRAQAESAATGVFHGVGVVTAIDAASGALTLDHDDIKGLMPAMEMMYRVKSPDLARGLSIGDKIGFDLDAKSYTILGVTPLGRAK